MTAIPQPGLSPAVTERLANPLRAVAWRQGKLAAAKALLQTLCIGLAVLLAAALLAGVFPIVPGWVRIAFSAMTGAVLFATAAAFFRPILHRRSLADAAFTVEQRIPDLHERISSAVELSTEHDPFLGSPLLVRHLVRQAESDAAAVRADAILPPDAVKRWALLLAPVLILWLTAALLAPRPLFAGLYRVLMPWRDHLPATLTAIAVTPGDVTLAEGDPLEINATINHRSGPEKSVGRALLLTRAAELDNPLSQDLQPLSPRQFKASLTNLRQSFSYAVSTDQGTSRWFTATVLPRPAVARLDLRYDFPAYTGVDPRLQPNSDGAIKALQGTDVTLTVHTEDALDLADGKSRIAITEGPRQRAASFKPVDGQPNVYEARLTVFNSGSYRIHLANRHGLTNTDDHPRAVVVEFDHPPKVAITAPSSEVSVRADDDVPVSFTASDDFGVATVQALVQVDDKPPEPIDVPLPRAADRRGVEAAWSLVVPAHLARAGVTEAKQITYWLRVTDNRDPDPQSAESAKQTLKIDSAQPLAYRTRLEQQSAKDLMQAIDRAIQRLQQADGAVGSLRDIDRSRAMNAEEKKRAAEQREHLAKTSEDLVDAAESNLRNAFSAVAARAKEIAETPIQGAAENVARSLLSAEQAEPRRAAAAEAAAQMADARKQLEELKKKVESRSKELQAAREIQRLAQKQSELAKAQPARDEKPNTAEQKKQQERQREKAQQRQRELAERLQRALGDSEPLRDPKATEQAIRLRELLDRLEQLQKDQSPLKQQLAKQEETARLAEQADTLAAKQLALNEAIERFAADQRAPLQRADTRAPEPAHQAAIIDRLRQNEPQPAHDMQRQSAEQLKQAHKQLQERGRSRDLRPGPPEQHAIARREQAKQATAKAAEQAKQAADQLREAKESKNEEQLAKAREKVDQSAQALAEQARAAAEAVRDAASSGDPTAEKNAAQAKQASEAAQAASEAARQAAQQGDAQQATKNLEEAGKHLAKAQDEALEATRADLLADQQAASKTAAEQAKQLAERQAELAEATKQTAKALEPARRDQQPPQDVANRQNQLKDQTQQALQQADQLEQLAVSTNPTLARRAAAAEELLKEATAAEAEAAQSEQAVAQAQQQASAALQQAAHANQQSAQHDQQAAHARARAADHQAQADASQRQAADAQQRKDESAARAAAEQLAQSKRQAEENQKQAENFRQQSAAAEKRSAGAAEQAKAARKAADAAREKAEARQSHAEQALARAEDALRDIDRMTADAAGERPDPSGEEGDPSPGEAQPAADAQANAQEAQGRDERPGQPGAPSPPAAPPLTPEQAMRQAAQGAQEAAQAQQQAMNQNADAGAIRQAAAALQQAAAAMSAATAASESADSAAAADAQAEAAADTAGAQETASAAASARTLDSRSGTGTGAGTHDGRPQSVQELGISAGDWARLGPLTRQELLNAAQQNGPPAYREMIKNYYVKIARLGRNGERK